MQLRGKTILLVGASSGIGRALALELAREGARLLLVARRGPLLEELAREIRGMGGSAACFSADTADREQVRRTYDAICRIAEPDGLIFNAGISAITLLDRCSSDETIRVLENNFYGFLYWLDHFLPLVRRRRTGFLAATTALCAYRGIPSGEAYSASKGALGNFLESLRVDLAPLGIPVFQLMPGFVKSPMSDLNNITSPLLIGAEKAARIVVRGMKKDRTRIEFGRGMSWAMRILRNLPDSLYERIFRKTWVLPRFNLERMIDRLPPFLCPSHGEPTTFDRYASWTCPRGDYRLSLVRDSLDLVDGTGRGGDDRVRLAYRFYSLIYPLAALGAMKFVWKGSLRRLLRFYRDHIEVAARSGRPFLDVATGDGSLTRLVLRKTASRPDFLSVDLSMHMMRKASRNLRDHPGRLFYVCDIGKVNLPEGSFTDILCYGGIHVFSDPRGALEKMRFLLAPGGRLSGSYLLRPGTAWADRLADDFVRMGLLSNSKTEEEMDRLFHDCGFRYRRKERNGRMLLFGLERR